MRAIVVWSAFVLSTAALGDAIAHGAWVAVFVLTLSTHSVLRQLWPPVGTDSV